MFDKCVNCTYNCHDANKILKSILIVHVFILVYVGSILHKSKNHIFIPKKR